MGVTAKPTVLVVEDDTAVRQPGNFELLLRYLRRNKGLTVGLVILLALVLFWWRRPPDDDPVARLRTLPREYICMFHAASLLINPDRRISI